MGNVTEQPVNARKIRWEVRRIYVINKYKIGLGALGGALMSAYPTKQICGDNKRLFWTILFVEPVVVVGLVILLLATVETFFFGGGRKYRHTKIE